MRRYRRGLARLAMIGIVATTLTGCDWLQYLGDSSHTSSTADAGIAATDIPNLASKWRWQPTGIPGRDNTLFSTPATWRGKIFVGSNNGVLVALNEQNGSQIWQHDFGSQPVLTCNGGGIVSSPAVADDGNGNPLVYIHAPDGYLYELDGNTGITKWRTVVQIPSTTVNDVFAWSSPALFGGRVYVGIASNCDTPFVRGAVKSFNATTGAPVATGWMMPSGYVGAGVWTSVAVDATGAYVSTGSVTASVQSQHPPTTTNGFNQYSIIKLDPVTLARTGKWAAPSAPTLGDPDFASSPVLFDGTIAGIKTPMVGACNKDGNFYALRRDTMQLVWQRRVGIPTDAGEANCIAGGMWDGQRLFLGGHATTINGVAFAGSVRRVNPSTGAIIWELGMAANPLGSGTINGNGILAYAGCDWNLGTGNGIYIIDAETGTLMRRLHDVVDYPEFAQPIWVDGRLFTANTSALVTWST